VQEAHTAALNSIKEKAGKKAEDAEQGLMMHAVHDSTMQLMQPHVLIKCAVSKVTENASDCVQGGDAGGTHR